MQMSDLIVKKRDGGALTTEEIQFMIRGYTDGTIPDYQMSAMTMAIYFRGMDRRETLDLTMAMMHSGDTLDLSSVTGVKADKHSTGGVGDKTSLVLVPMMAARGVKMAKMSGRGLGHTGGTLDKLESIPGVCIEQPMERFKEIVNDIGVAVIGQTGNLVPADKKMYALRDVTATVRSIPLIASSIMSKKLAAGTDAIVLDVKTGTGAFMSTVDEAEKLAHLMTSIGKLVGRECVAVITDMNQPLGLAVGNALEVREAVELLSEKIPAGDPLYEVCMLLGVHMMRLSKLAATEVEAREKLESALHSGRGLEKLREMIAAEGGDPSYISLDRIDELCEVKEKLNVYPKQAGYISSMNAERIGTAAQILGAGRATKEESIDPAVGLVMKKRLGDFVRADEPLCVMYINDMSKLDAALEMFHSAFTYSENKPEYRPMVYDVVRA
ncbi:MAG: pyrimidine-nucleoside phosphorylase [Clostridia bacterium]|nr:pyrimidine-nucleoside phosphorylase [Clostridia bacterium]